MDNRVVAATNKNLAEEVQAGRFREDLFYRLNVIPIKVPPLKKRRTDIPLLLNHFLKQNQKSGITDIKGFSTEATDAMLEYNWPGNVRELQNTIQRFVTLGKLDFLDLDEELQQVDSRLDY